MKRFHWPLRAALAYSVTLFLALATPARAQQTPGDQSAINQQLLDRIQELEKQVELIKAQLPAHSTPTSIPPPPPAPTPVPATVSVEDTPVVNEAAPRLKLMVFGDVGAQGYNHTPDTFLFGSLDIFMSARLSERVSTLGEVLFLADNNNLITADVERLLLTYRRNDFFHISAGRFHTWVGYYNTAFNYGEFLETTTDRPLMYAFHAQGGVLPMNEVGVTATGKIPSGRFGLNYVVEAGNGANWKSASNPVQNNQDWNNSKSINGGLFMRPERYSGLQLGFSVRHDNLTVSGPAVHETIAAAHAVFINSNYEILNEVAYVRHVEPVGGGVFNTDGFYTQWSRRFGLFRPYFRYQYFNADSDDPVYLYSNPNDYQPPAAASFVGRVNGPSLGIRYDFTEHSALKLQYDRISERGFGIENGLTTQIAFTF